MPLMIGKLGCLLGFLALLPTRPVTAEEQVIHLTKDTFDNFVNTNRDRSLLVKFYASWCPHCKAIAPEYEAAANEVKDVLFADIDGEQEEELAEEFDIDGYPTLKLLHDGIWLEYTGGRTKDEIIDWLKRATGPAVVVANGEEEAMRLVKAAGTPLSVIVSAPESTTGLWNVTMSVAAENRLLASWILLRTDREKIRIFRESDGAVIEKMVTSALSEELLLDLIVSERLPPFGPISEETFSMYTENGLDFLWFASDSKAYEANKEEMTKLGTALRGRYNLVWVDVELFGSDVEDLVAGAMLPAIVLSDTGAGRHIYMETFDMDKVLQFLLDVEEGRLSPTLKSEPPVESNDDLIKIVTGNSFADLVFHHDKDVLLEVYASWCGHCKTFAPEYDLVAEALEEESRVIVSKIDGTLNEIPFPGFEYEGFPTLYYVQAGNSDPLMHEGDLSFESVMEFVTANASFDNIKIIDHVEPQKEEL